MSMAPESNAPDGKKKRSEAQQPKDKPVGKQRRPGMMALALMLIAVSALGGVWLATRGNETRDVVMVARNVPYGQAIAAEDLEVRAFPVDVTDIATVSYDDLDAVVGQVARRDLAENTLLTPDSYGDTLEVGEGRVIIGVTVTPDRMPAVTLRPGDVVTLVETPAQGSDLSTGSDFQATFISQDGIDVTSEVRLTLEVSDVQASSIAARAAVDRLYVIVGETVPGGEG